MTALLEGALAGAAGRDVPWLRMSPTWLWMQIAIVAFVLAGMVIAIVKLV